MFTDQIGIASSKREAPYGIRRVTPTVSCILKPLLDGIFFDKTDSVNEMIDYMVLPTPGT